MIKDQETNFIYFSSLIKEKPELRSFWHNLERVLKKESVQYGFIQNTKDIWCRDYMPVQVAKNRFVQFTFDPHYLKEQKYRHLRTETEQLIPSPTLCATLKKSSLVLDGGNLVHSENTVILTKTALRDNDVSHDVIINELRQTLQIDHVYLLPKQPHDFTGHADGMVRLINDQTLLVADYISESSTWREKYKKALDLTGLKLIDFPNVMTNFKNKEGDYTALGCYINFAWVGNIILFPQFDFPEDKCALKEAQKIFKDYKLIPITATELAMSGGVLNCATWNIKI